MGKEEGKIRLLRMLELLQTESDEQHPISTPDAIRLLKERWGLEAYRITILRDVEALIAAGYDVRIIHARQNRYYLASRTFEQAELKLLTDAPLCRNGRGYPARQLLSYEREQD